MAKKKKLKQPEKKSNTILIYAGLALLVIIVLVTSLTLYSEKPLEKLPSAGEFTRLDKPTTYEPGKVKMTVFLKFDCPHCYTFDNDLPQLLKKYGNNVSVTYVPVVWRGQSTKSIEAYILAEEMGKSDEMREALFQAKFRKGMDIMESVLALEDVAASIGLGADFNTRLERDEAKQAALENLRLMRDYNIHGTPTVILNGNLLVNHSISNLDAVIGSLLSK